ncbi:hypothetical protein GA0115240_11733 [Streptomyces sp. DvalAA-14]|nr:hypothetical protein GA0115240_11733 [Streptomyces sp. DvalAA-14]
MPGLGDRAAPADTRAHVALRGRAKVRAALRTRAEQPAPGGA